MHSITRRDEMGGGGKGWSEKTVEGGGGRLLYTNLYMSRVKSYDNTHKLFNPIKKGLLLIAIQIRGTAETRRCVADAVRLQLITLNALLSLRASYLPLPPPPSSSPCSHSCPLSPSLLIQHMVYRGVSTQLPLIKSLASQFCNKSFCSSFPPLLHTRTFFAIRQSSTRKSSFPLSSLLQFLLLLNKHANYLYRRKWKPPY
jgi:hypothetical protein